MLPLLIGGMAAAGALGALSNASAQERANMLQEKGMQEWFKVNLPNPAEQKLALERFVQTGELHPALEQQVKAAESQFNNVNQDPALRNSRLRALSALEEQGYGGEQVQDAAARQKALIESNAANAGRVGAINQAFARRGQLGSGLSLTSQLSNAQSTADRNASNALDIEAARRNRALQAIEGGAQLAGDINKQDIDLASRKAEAQDVINRFNTQNLIGMNQRNVDRGNDAQQFNLGLKQDIANKNVGLSNMEQQYNKELLQQQYENQMKKAAGVSGQYGQMADNAAKQGAAQAGMWGGIAGGLGSLAGASMVADARKAPRITANPVTEEYTGTYDPEKYLGWA